MAHELDLRLLKTLKVLYETQSYTLTAETIGRTQPAVTQQIRKLEEQCGFDLLCHRKGVVEFTPIGEELARKADGAIRFMRDFTLDLLPGGESADRGGIKIGITEELLNFSRDLWDRLAEDYDFEMRVLPSNTILSRFRNRQIDIGLMKSRQAIGRAHAVWRDDVSWHCLNRDGLSRDPIKVSLLSEDCLYYDLAIERLHRSQVRFSMSALSCSWHSLFDFLKRDGVTIASRRNSWPLSSAPSHLGLPALPPVAINLLSRTDASAVRYDEARSLTADMLAAGLFADFEPLA